MKALRQPDPDEQDMQTIRALYDKHKGRYGQRRIAATLRWNKKKVARLMKKMGLQSVVRPKKPYHPPAMGKPSDNLLQRNFQAQQPDCKWLTDVTEFKCQEGKLYLSPILDLFNREIIAYSLSRRPNSEMVGKMLSEAVGKLGGKRPVLHSDQGVLYRTHEWRQKLAAAGIVQSMSRKGNCWDNAPMESFFAVLKTECFHGRTFASLRELEEEIREYIHYYNHERCSLRLKNLSPVAYRTQVRAAA